MEEHAHLYKPLLLDPKNSEAERIYRLQLVRRLTETGTERESEAQFLAGGLLSAVTWWLRIENRDISADRFGQELEVFFSRN